MSRSGYSDDYDGADLTRYRGQVASAIRGKRGQAFLRELIEALDALPEKRLIAADLWNGEVCALGAVGLKRDMDMTGLDPTDHRRLADLFGIARQLVMEIEYENDEGAGYWVEETPEARWRRMRDWVAGHLIEWDPA